MQLTIVRISKIIQYIIKLTDIIEYKTNKMYK